jgi:trehalose 6-phosphate synthase
VLGAEVDYDTATVVHDGRRTLVTSHPIGIDPLEFDELKDDPGVLDQERAIIESRREFLLVRVDRTDPSKNVVRGFRSFGLFLDMHPELHGRVTMLALLDPSRQDIPEYSEYLGAIQREARTVNDRFQHEGWVPIDLQIADNFAQSVAAYKQYDALLVNSVFDGLNLVSKEGPLVNQRDGVLILSENAGSHDELGEWAVTVNPFDVYGQAQAIHEALTMSLEQRRERLAATQAHVRSNDLAAWIAAQLADLDRVSARVPS